MALLDKIFGEQPTEVALLGVEFGWEGSSPANSAVPILPDLSGWSSGHHSFVAYSRKEIADTVKAGQLQIKARFRKNSPGGRLQVRATVAEEEFTAFRSLMQTASIFHTENISNLSNVLRGQPVENKNGRSVLGEVAPVTVYFDTEGESVYRGKENFVPLLLQNPALLDLGVGIYDVDWKWEFRLLDESLTTEDEDAWQEKWYPIVAERPLSLSHHRVFLLLDSPRFPWTPQRVPDFDGGPPCPMPANPQALALACTWASGATDKGMAAKLIADALNKTDRFTYSTNSSYSKDELIDYTKAWKVAKEGSEAVFLKAFYLSKAIERIAGGEGLGGTVNCLDCALIVASLANLLGCSLRVSKLQNTEEVMAGTPDFIENNRFEVNTIRAIGLKNSAVTMAGLKMGDKYYFSYHAIPWQAAPGYEMSEAQFSDPDNVVYDACVNFLDTPDEKGNERYLSAAGLPLGHGGQEGSYIQRLAAAGKMGSDRCIPQQVTAVHVQLR